MADLSIVYVLTNPAMPGLVKIGTTASQDTETRISQLYSTGVPVPFEIAGAAKVENGTVVEQALHTAFAPQRVNPRREFFRIDPEQALVILRLLQKEDVTNLVKQEDTLDAESIAAGEQLRKRRPNMNFQEMDIPIGATLQFTQGDEQVSVVGPRKVKLGDEEMTLTAATRQLSNTDYDRPPAMYWRYQGKLLRDIYEETYEQISE